jgi:hypothetical protein
MTLRISQAVLDALGKARSSPVERVKGIRQEVTVQVRSFDEARDDAAVVAYEASKARNPKAAQLVIETFRAMRKELAPLQGQSRKTWIQVIQVGETAIVAVPAEFFTVLGQDIKRRSPFRYTYVFELANDYIGYVADRRGYELGGYQTWTGLHSFVPPGTGEMIVDEAVKLLDRLYDEARPR